MKSKHLVDPELAPILDLIPASVLTREALKQIRAMSPRPSLDSLQTPEISVSEHLIPGPADAPDVRMLIFKPTPAQDSIPVLLWIHGGGYIMGSADAEAA